MFEAYAWSSIAKFLVTNGRLYIITFSVPNHSVRADFYHSVIISFSLSYTAFCAKLRCVSSIYTCTCTYSIICRPVCFS